MLKQNGCHFADDIFKLISLHENYLILIPISMQFVHKSPMKKKPVLVSDNGWAPIRRQAIIWTNVGLFIDAYVSPEMCSENYTSLVSHTLSELTHWGLSTKIAAILWTTFSRILNKTSLNIFPIDKMSSLVWIITWCLTSNKPLPKTIIIVTKSLTLYGKKTPTTQVAVIFY